MQNSFKLILLLSIVGLIFTSQHFNGYLKNQAKAKHGKEYKHFGGAAPNDYNTGFYNQTLDHYHYGVGTQSSKWSQRYLYNDTYWGGAENLSPILFYCGNEADVSVYWTWDRFIIDVLGPELQGYLLFAEHRYFGQSMPFGNSSFDGTNVQYLTTDQALADYAVFLQYYKKEVLNCPSCPVIAFGGSYGGMLAAWMRMKFPNVIDGALAGSAPIRMFSYVENPEVSYEIITWDFYNASTTTCGPAIREGFSRLVQYSQSSGNQYETVNKAFNACKPLVNNEDIGYALNYLTNAYFTIAELDYPFPCDYVTPMPAWPVEVACEAFVGVDANSSDLDLFTAMAKSSNVFYSYNQTTCSHLYNPSSGDLNGLGWPVLACSEIAMIMPNNGVQDFFPASPFNKTQNNEYCQQTFGLDSRYDYVLNYFGGWELSDYDSYSNIFFSNGQLDPWLGGGVTTNISSSLIAFIIEEGAHHLDLYGPTPEDPPSVILARQMETNYIKQWIAQKRDTVMRNRKTEDI